MHEIQSIGLTRRSRGRPREFEMDVALDAAVRVFRERGYHAASLSDLGTAMKLTPGSIYKAFDDKRAIFLGAFERYIDIRRSQLRPLLEAEADGLGKLRAMLTFYAETSHDAEGRLGCLVAGSTTELSTFDPELAARVTAALAQLEATIRDLIHVGQADGSVPPGIDAAATAAALLCLLEGMRVVGKAGRTRKQMMAVVGQGLRLLT